MMADTATLVAQAGRGDQQAWDMLVERYAPLIWSICRRYRLSASDAEDVGQSVWLLLVDRLNQIRDPAALPGWIDTTTRRECGRVVRAAASPYAAVPAATVETTADEQAGTAEDGVLAAERHAVLLEALAGLPPAGQQLMTLLIADPPLPYTTISATLGIPVGSIGPTRRRYLYRMRRHPAMAALIRAERQGLTKVALSPHFYLCSFPPVAAGTCRPSWKNHPRGDFRMRTAGLLVTVACACLLAAACSSGTTSSAAAATHYTYARHYVSGEVTRYTYTEQQAGAAGKLTAVAQLTAYARDGVGGEQVKWITLTDPEGHNLDAQARAFPPYDLSLDSSAPDALALPKGVSGELQGPVDDLLTFYVDLSSKAGIGYLHEPGDSHVDSKPLTGNFATASTPVGQDFIQLTTTLTRLTAQQATFRSSYQPPPSGGLKLYRPFMSSPACHGAPNNFELVQKSGSGYAVLWGCESFVVTTVVERATGQIISVRMTNPLMLKGKMCLEVALTKCGNIPATQEERIVMLTRSAA